MNQPTSTKNLAGQSGPSWRARTQNFHHASSRNLTTSQHRNAHLALAGDGATEKEVEKKREVSIEESVHKPWLRPSEDFIPLPELGRPSGGSSPVIHYFVDQKTGSRWIGKVGQVPLRDREVNEAARRMPGFLGVYVDEILEKLGLAVYQLLGTEVPESALSYQQVTMEAMHPDMLLAMQLNAKDEGRIFELPHSPRMHYLSRYVDEFQPLDKDFVEHYLANAKRCGNEHVKIQTKDGEMLRLRGLGSMLAAADFVYDLDCLGDACGNSGYVIREERATGERYVQLVKIDAGYAFSYSDLRTDQTHNPRDRQIRIAPNKMRLQFADLAAADQAEFAEAAKLILAIPQEQLELLFSKTEALNEGLSAKHWQQLLDELIARKGLFLKAFAPETDQIIINEIESAQAKLARNLERKGAISSSTIKELLSREREEAKALAELRVRLAVVDAQHSEPRMAGECETFQLPSSSTYFVGRNKALSDIAKNLLNTQGGVSGQAISGMGGVGKTQLALYYAHAAANGKEIGGCQLAYDHVIWLNAEAVLEVQFQALAEMLLGRKLQSEEVSSAVSTVYSHLKGKRTLIIFDNAESACTLSECLPPPEYVGQIHLLITSRSMQWGGMPLVKLSGFSVEEALDYVEFHLGSQLREEVVNFLELLGGLPLAISQSVAYIRASQTTLEDFVLQFNLNQAHLLSHELIEHESHPKTVATTLTLAIAQARVQSSIVEQLLGVAAYMSPDGIQLQLLVSALQKDLEEVRHAVEVLASYSLISVEKGEVRIHRLVQEVLRHHHTFFSKPETYWEKTVAILSEVIDREEKCSEEALQASNAIPHVQQISNLSKIRTLTYQQKLVLIRLLSVSALHQQFMGYYKIACDLQERVLEVKTEHYQEEDVNFVNTLVSLAAAYGALGKFTIQKKFLKRALKIAQKHFDSDHIEVGSILGNLGTMYGALGNRKKQKEHLERSLRIMTQYYGEEHIEVAKVLVNLSNAYGAFGDVRKKKETLESALKIQKSHYGNEHPELAITFANLGAAYGMLGDVNKQKELLEIALKINEKHYGVDHPQVAKILVSLGAAYGVVGDLMRQKELLERALDINERYYGMEHVEITKALNNLSLVYGALGDINDKKNLLERALKINKQFYGNNHPRVATILVNLANTFFELDNPRAQKNLLKDALRTNQQHYGADHPEVASTLVNLSTAYGALGKISKQKQLLEEALVVEEKFYGANHVQVGMSLFNLAYACLNLHEVFNAKTYANRVYSIFRQCYGDEHQNTQKVKALLKACEDQTRGDLLSLKSSEGKRASALIKLSRDYRNLSNFIKEKEMLEYVVTIYKNYYGYDHLEVGMLLLEIGNLYGLLGSAQKRKRVFERASTIIERHKGPEDYNVGISLMNLGIAYGDLRDPQKQKIAVKRAMSIFTKNRGAEDKSVGIACMYLSKAYQGLSNFLKQKEYAEKALEILGNAGTSDIVIARSLVSLGEAHGALGNFKKHKELVNKAIVVVEKQCGKHHGEYAQALVSLSRAYGASGSPGKQEALLNIAINIQQSYYESGNHVEVAKTLFELACVCLTLKREFAAIEHATKAFSIFKAAYGENDKKTLEASALLQRLRGFSVYQDEISDGENDIGKDVATERSVKESSGLLISDNENEIVWEHSLAKAGEKNPQVIRLAGILAYLSPSEIQIEFLVSALRISERDLKEVMEVMARHELIKFDERKIFIHVSLQTFIRSSHEHLVQRDTYCGQIIKILEEVVMADQIGFEKSHVFNGAVMHIQFLAKVINLGMLEKKQQVGLVRLLAISGMYQKMLGNVAIAKDCFKQMLEVLQYGSTDSLAPVATIALGPSYSDSRFQTKQVSSLEGALSSLSALNSEFDTLTLAYALLNIGSEFADLWELKRSEELLVKVLHIFEKHYGDIHPQLVYPLIWLGVTYYRLGEIYKSREVLERALDVSGGDNGNGSVDVGYIVSNLALAYGALGEVDKQKELQDRAVNIFEQYCGGDSYAYGIALMYLAKAYGDKGEISIQRQLAMQALLVLEKNLGNSDPDVARALIILGEACGALGEFEDQKQLLKRAIDIFKQYVGENHVEIAQALVGLAKAYGVSGSFGKQESLLLKALKIQQDHYDDCNNIMLLPTVSELALACILLRKYSAAERYVEQAILIGSKYYGENHQKIKEYKMLLSNIVVLAEEDGNEKKRFSKCIIS